MKKNDRANEKIWIWYCGFDNWTWSDGERCRARSRKPTTRKTAESGLKCHFKKHPDHTRASWGCELRKGHVEIPMKPLKRKKKIT